MALKHYQGSTPGARAAWKCPTCGTENTGPLEQGCTNCKAGADAKKVDPLLSETPYRATTRPAAGFATWWEEYGQDLVARLSPKALAESAYNAGMADMLPVGDLPRTEADALVDAAFIDLQDPTVRATLAAALAFYIDNTLAYGAVPGQLDQQQARELLAQLQPPDAAPAPDPDIPF